MQTKVGRSDVPLGTVACREFVSVCGRRLLVGLSDSLETSVISPVPPEVAVGRWERLCISCRQGGNGVLCRLFGSADTFELKRMFK